MVKSARLGRLWTVKLIASCLLLLGSGPAFAEGATCRRALFSYDLVRSTEDAIEIALPTKDGTYQYFLVESWRDVDTLLEKVPLELRTYHRELLSHAEAHFRSLVIKYRSLAERAHGELSTRLKEPDSLSRKLIERARSYQKDGKQFSNTELHDLIGMRLTLPLDSERWEMGQDRDAWARFLQLESPSQILEIEVKGTPEDRKLGKFYRAVHLAIRDSLGVEFELQAMTKLVSLWHRWDHSTVYKSKDLDPQKIKRLKKYSTAWIKVLTTLEDISQQKQLTLALNEIWNQLAWRPTFDTSWMLTLDAHFRLLYGIPKVDSFLMYPQNESPVPTLNRRLVRELQDVMDRILALSRG